MRTDNQRRSDNFGYRGRGGGGGGGSGMALGIVGGIAAVVLIGLMVWSLWRAPSSMQGAQRGGEATRDCAECPEMVAIPGGSFTMGSPASEPGHDSNEGPQHIETVRAFEASKYEITFAQWDACVANGGCGGYRPADEGWGRENRPVINVSWNDAQSYVQWLSQRSGRRYRLLSDAEWEYAARAGTTTAYWWGNSASHEYANYGADTCCSGLAYGRDQWVNTSPVGSFPGNPFGLYDMHGNVFEWVEDCLSNSFDSTESCVREYRGGDWDNYPHNLRSAFHFWEFPWRRGSELGFRVAKSEPGS